MKPKLSNNLKGDFFGAFGDGAILFPLIALLSLKGGFSGVTLLTSAAIAYIVSGLIFRIPISVQPLKSIAIASIAIGASSLEIRLSGALLGITCLFITFFNVNQLAKKIPQYLIHGVQASLGVLLIFQGIKTGFGSHFNMVQIGTVLILLTLMLYLPALSGITMMGFVATSGLIYSILFNTDHSQNTSINQFTALNLRPSIIFSLVLPQIALTLANSVLGTEDVCRRYFGEKAHRVTIKKLLNSIGIGNLISSLIGGLPYCHGAGGVTAHYQAGARSFLSNIIIGICLIILAIAQTIKGGGTINYPPILLSSLLLATGFLHLKLAKPTWKTTQGPIYLIAMIIAVVLTQNILWALAVGFFMGLFKQAKNLTTSKK